MAESKSAALPLGYAPKRIRAKAAKLAASPAQHNAAFEHDPEKWEPVFGLGHAQTRMAGVEVIQLGQGSL